jgi:hypothetical protein
MYTAVKGIYENGILKFTETPPSVEKSEVLILFMEEHKKPKTTNKKTKGGIVLGSLANKGYNLPDNFNDPLEDFKDYM